MTASTPDPFDTYSRMRIETASHSRVVCMLHDRCALQLRQAKQFPDERRAMLDKTQNILVLLQHALKQTDATSRSLYHLYDYCYCLLESGSDREIANAYTLLNTVRQTFNYLQKHPG
ncbi:MAG: flagellar protein FliS [Chitinispirillaceae bacterium]|nr:flagellar protein FliS [Chitinispirillaceae bacterium]